MKTTINGAEEPDLTEAAIRARLDGVLGAARTPTGTLLAHALHDLFIVEVSETGRRAALHAWATMDDTAIEELSALFLRLTCSSDGSDHALPAGTQMIPGPGRVIVGSETLGMDVDRPGLHPIDDLPYRPGGSNLALLLKLIEEMSRDVPWSEIGAPTLVDRLDSRHSRYLLQFPPFPPAGGAVLQKDMSFAAWGVFFCAFSGQEVRDLAADIAKDMHHLWQQRAVIADRVTCAREAAKNAALGLTDVRVHAVTLELKQSIFRAESLTVAAEFETWDHTFRRGIVAREVHFKNLPNHAIDTSGIDCARSVRRVQALGADGRIEALARAIVNAAPGGAAPVLAELGTQFETRLEVPGEARTFEFRLYWEQGVICARASNPWLFYVGSNTVRIRDRSLPEQIVIRLPGMPLHTVFDRPFRCDTPIVSVEEKGGCLSIEIEPDRWLVNCREGLMWREPQGSGLNEIPDF